MTAKSINLKALKFGNRVGGEERDCPTRVVVDFPADTLYTLAAIHGVFPHAVLTPDAARHASDFYGFVSGHVANRFYDDGVSEAMPAYTVFNSENTLAWCERGPQSASQQQLADRLEQSISAHFGDAETSETAAERRDLAEVLAQVVTNQGWRHVVTVGR